jgi:toxin ParE1/3/4
VSRYRIRAAARRDLVDHYAYLAETAGIATADRFLLAAESSFALLATQKLMGPALATNRPPLRGIRKWAVGGFPYVLVFYKPRRGGISVIRVLHGSRDWWGLLGLQGD